MLQLHGGSRVELAVNAAYFLVLKCLEIVVL